jgi:hypothetical protein
MVDLSINLRPKKGSSQRAPVSRRLVMTVAVSVELLLVGLFIFGAWRFAQSELQRLRAPLNGEEKILQLRRADLEHFVRRLRATPPPPPAVSPGIPSPSPAGRRRVPSPSPVTPLP